MAGVCYNSMLSMCTLNLTDLTTHSRDSFLCIAIHDLHGLTVYKMLPELVFMKDYVCIVLKVIENTDKLF